MIFCHWVWHFWWKVNLIRWKQPFCLVLVNGGENLLHYPFSLFLVLFLLFFIQSILFCCQQLSALKRAKLHVLARMSAANLVILFTLSSSPVDISLPGNSPCFVFQVCPCLCRAIAWRPQSSFHSALQKELYNGCKYLARYESCSCVLRSSWPIWTCIGGLSMTAQQQKFF